MKCWIQSFYNKRLMWVSKTETRETMIWRLECFCDNSMCVFCLLVLDHFHDVTVFEVKVFRYIKKNLWISCIQLPDLFVPQQLWNYHIKKNSSSIAGTRISSRVLFTFNEQWYIKTYWKICKTALNIPMLLIVRRWHWSLISTSCYDEETLFKWRSRGEIEQGVTSWNMKCDHQA